METAVKDTSLMALEKVNRRLEPDQLAVLELLEEIGPAHDLRLLEALNQKEQKSLKPREFRRAWKINQVTARRNELVKLGLIRDIGMYNGFWEGRAKTYHFWMVQGDYRCPAGWVRQPDRSHAIVIPDKCASCRYRRQFIRQAAERPVVERLNASAAGSVLARYGHGPAFAGLRRGRQSRKSQLAETATLFG
ncbi:MAG: hypothetical protein ABSG99_02850 [Sedimentisphaerales bacterium]